MLFARTVVTQPPSLGRRMRRAAIKATARGTYRTTRWIVRRSYTSRRGLAPVYAAAMLAGTAIILHAAQDGPEVAATVGGLAAVGVWQWARHRKLVYAGLLSRLDKPDARKLAYAWALWLYSTLWLIAAAFRGVTAVPVRTGLAVGLAAFGTAWWWHHRIRPEPEQELPEQERIWLEELAGPHRPLRDAEMLDLHVNGPEDFSFNVQLRRQQTKHLLDAQGAIAAAYGLPLHAVVAEGAPDQRNDAGRVTVSRRNPTSEPVELDESWLGVDDDGCYQIAVYPDGQRARLRLYERRSGCSHAIYSGDTRMGKSTAMSISCDQGAWAGLTVPGVLDMQGGLSMPAWCGPSGIAPYQAAGRVDDTDDVFDLLAGFGAVAIVRADYLAQREWEPEPGDRRQGMSFYDPHLVPELPMLDIYIPEAQLLLAIPEGLAVIKQAVSTWAKLGMRVSVDTQYPDVSATGGDQGLRTNLSQNVVCCRNHSKDTGVMMLSSHMPPPHSIPASLPSGATIKGLAIIESSAPGTDRPTISRIVYARNEFRWAERAAERMPTIDTMSGDAIASTIARRRADRAERARRVAEAAARRAAEQGHDIPAPRDGDRETITVSAPIPTGSVRDRAIEFLATHQHGHATTGTIAKAIGATTNAVSTALRRAEVKGDVVDLSHGVWGLPGVSHSHREIVLDGAAA